MPDADGRRRLARRDTASSRSRSAERIAFGAACAPPPSCPSSRSAAPSSGSTPRSASPTRAELAAAMVGDVLAALGARAAGSTTLIVVTAEPRAAAAAREAGAHVVDDPAETGQSDAAALGVAAARGARRRARAARPRRLPGARPGRGRGAARRRSRDAGVVIVPDRHGTRHERAAAHAAGRASRPSFGPGSFARHAALGAAARRGRARRARRRRSSSTSTRRATSPRCATALARLPDAAPRTRALLERLAPRSAVA